MCPSAGSLREMDVVVVDFLDDGHVKTTAYRMYIVN